jgi:hypothetical protein
MWVQGKMYFYCGAYNRVWIITEKRKPNVTSIISGRKIMFFLIILYSNLGYSNPKTQGKKKGCTNV